MGDQCQKRPVYPYLLQFIHTSYNLPRLTNVKKHEERERTSQSPPTVLTSVKKTRRVEANKTRSINSDRPMSKRQDVWERTSQSPPTVTDQYQKDKMSGSAQVKVHQQWLTNVKKTRRVGAYKTKSTNSD